MTASPRPDLHLVAVAYGKRGPADEPTRGFDLRREEWMKRAACRYMGAEYFWPARGRNREVRAVKELCGGCPVRAECLDYADRCIPIEAGGIWGGLSARQRRARRREINRAAS